MRAVEIGQRVPNPTAVARMTEGSYICSYDPVLTKGRGKPEYRVIEQNKPSSDPRLGHAINACTSTLNSREYNSKRVFSLPQFAREIPTNRCIVVGIDKLIQRTQILAAFSIVGSLVNGTVERCQLHTSRETGQSLGIVDVRFSKVEAAVELRKICDAHKLVLAAQPAPNVRFINYTEETDLQEIISRTETETKTRPLETVMPKFPVNSADPAISKNEEYPTRDFNSVDPRHVARWFERHLPPKCSYIQVRSRHLRPPEIPKYQIDDMFKPYVGTRIVANVIGYYAIFPGREEAINCYIELIKDGWYGRKFRFFLYSNGYSLSLREAYLEQSKYVRDEAIEEISQRMRGFLRNEISAKLRQATRDAVVLALHKTLDPGDTTKNGNIPTTSLEMDENIRIEPGTLMNYTFDARKRRVDEINNAKKRQKDASPVIHTPASDTMILSDDENYHETHNGSIADATAVKNSPNSVAGLVDKMDIGLPEANTTSVKEKEEIGDSGTALSLDFPKIDAQIKLPSSDYGPKRMPIDEAFAVKRPQRQLSLAEHDAPVIQPTDLQYSRFAEYDPLREYDAVCAPLLQLQYNRAFAAVDYSNQFMQSTTVTKRKRAMFRPRVGKAQYVPHRTFVGRSSIHAWGLFAGEDIPEKKLVIEYVGSRIRAGLADVRELQYQLSGVHSTYFFRVGKDAVIDATAQGNAARFMNHSCDPNCDSAMLKVDDIERVGLFTTRPISKNEELTFNYRFTPSGDNEQRLKCHCGAPNCSTYLT